MYLFWSGKWEMKTKLNFMLIDKFDEILTVIFVWSQVWFMRTFSFGIYNKHYPFKYNLMLCREGPPLWNLALRYSKGMDYRVFHYVIMFSFSLFCLVLTKKICVWKKFILIFYRILRLKVQDVHQAWIVPGEFHYMVEMVSYF